MLKVLRRNDITAWRTRFVDDLDAIKLNKTANTQLMAG
jgi:hypothetical protein